MCVNKAEFDFFEQEFIELVGEFQSLTFSETKLREALRIEATRAEALAADRDAAVRSAADVRANAAATAAGAAHATAALASKQDELVTVQTQLDLAEKERALLQEKCSDMTKQINAMERELLQLRPVQAAQGSLQRQYVELQERVRSAASDARSEASRLEAELRRVERCAGAGAEVRERARLAAAAHARERRLAATEMQHLTAELKAAYVEISRLGVVVADLQQKLCNVKEEKVKNDVESKRDSLEEIRAALEAERAGSARLEKALAAAVADNATLAAQLHAADQAEESFVASPSKTASTSNNICPIDTFLAD